MMQVENMRVFSTRAKLADYENERPQEKQRRIEWIKKDLRYNLIDKIVEEVGSDDFSARYEMQWGSTEVYYRAWVTWTSEVDAIDLYERP